MRWLVGALTVLALAAGARAGSGAARGGLTEDLRYRMAVEAAQHRKWERARSLFENLRKTYAGDDRVVYQLGQVLIEMGRDAQAQALALGMLSRDPSDRWGKALMERLRQKTGAPEAPLTFGDDPEEAARTWERGDELHLAVPIGTKGGAVVIGAPRLLEGPAPAMTEPAPGVRYTVRLEGPGVPAREVALDPAPGPTALVERPGKDGTLSGQLVPVPPGFELEKTAWLPFTFGATRIVVRDPQGAVRAQRAVPAQDVYAWVVTLARPRRVPGLGPPISPARPGKAQPSKLFPLARLSAKLPHEYSPSGQPAAMWLRVRLVAELFVYPGLRKLPDAEVPRACPYLVWPLLPPDAAAVEALIGKLVLYLEHPGAPARQAVQLAAAPLLARVDTRLVAALDAYRRQPGAPAPELRALVTLALASARIGEIAWYPPSSTDAKSKAAEALLLLSRFRLERKK